MVRVLDLFDAAQPRLSHSIDRSPRVPELTDVIAQSGQVSVSHLSRPTDEILDLWDRSRFVRQGWLTAQEAVTYLDLLVFHP